MGVAQLIGLAIALAVGVGSGYLEATPPPEDPGPKLTPFFPRHRVPLDVPPVDAALWFVDTYPGYFANGEGGVSKWAATLPEAEREYALGLAQTLVWEWVERETAAYEANGEDLDALGREAITSIREKTLNQLDMNFHDYEEETPLWAERRDPDFTEGIFARLVRGASNCDGQNHLLELLLDTWVESKLVGTRSGHKLVRLEELSDGQPVFMDAWSNFPPLRLRPEGETGFETVGRGAWEPSLVVERAAKHEAEPPANYRASGGRPIEIRPARDIPALGERLTVPPPVIELASYEEEVDPWRLYLRARVLHIFDDPRAGMLYQDLIARACEPDDGPAPFECVAAPQLLARHLDRYPS